MGKHIAPEKVNTSSRQKNKKQNDIRAEKISSRVEPVQANHRAETTKFRGMLLSRGIKNYFSQISSHQGEKDYSGDMSEMLILMAAFLMFDVLVLLKGRLGIIADYLQIVPLLLCLIPVIKDSVTSIIEAYLTDVSIYIVLSSVILALSFSCCAAAAFVLFCSLFRFIDHNIKNWSSNVQTVFEPEEFVTLVHGENGECEIIEAGDVKPGDIIRFLPGTMICFDGVVSEGGAEVSNIFRDSKEAKYGIQKGSPVLSGSYIETGSVDVLVQNPLEDSFSEYVGNCALAQKGLARKKEKTFKKLNTVFSIIRAVLFLLMFFISAVNHAWKQNFTFFAVYLIVSCVDYLYLAECARMSVCLRSVKEYGVFFSNRNIPDKLANVNTFVFGMTGTLTDGNYAIMEVVPFGLSKNALLAIAVAAESNSEHVIAKSLRNACSADLSSIPAPSKFSEYAGQGIAAVLGGKTVVVGITRLLNSFGIQCVVPDKPGIAIHVAVDKQYAGYILLTDRVRDYAFEMIDDLRFRGVERAVLLTGNVPSAAKKVGISLNIDMIKSELNTEQKLTALDYLSVSNREGKITAFIGTKEDECPLIEGAQVGIALDGNDFNRIFSSSDISVTGKDLMSIPAVYGICLAQNRMVSIFEYICMGVAALIMLGTLLGLFKLPFVLTVYLLLRIGLYIAACDGVEFAADFIRKK